MTVRRSYYTPRLLTLEKKSGIRGWLKMSTLTGIDRIYTPVFPKIFELNQNIKALAIFFKKAKAVGKY